MLPFPQLFNTSLAPVLSGYDQFVRQAQAEIAGGFAMKASTTENVAPYYTNNNKPIRIYLEYETSTQTMWGTSYNSRFSWDSNFFRIAQHAFPTTEIYLDYKNKKRWCMIEYSAFENNPAIDGINRNEYQSANVRAQPGNRCINFVYYDEILDQMMSYNPSILSTPIPY